MTQTRTGHAGRIGAYIPPDRIENVLAAASDITLTLNRAGIIQSVLVSPDSRALGDLSHWRDRDIVEFLTKEAVTKLRRRMEELAQGRPDALRPIELNHVDRATWEFPIRYTLWQENSDSPLILMGQDMRPIAEIQQQLVAAQVALERDYEYNQQVETRYRVMLESNEQPVLFADAGTGRIIDLNQAAVLLLKADRASITGRQLDQVFPTPGRSFLHDQLGLRATGASDARIEVLSTDGTRRMDLFAKLFRAAGVATLMVRVEEQKKTPDPRPHDTAIAKLFASASDGIAILDAKGTLTAANDAFLSQCDMAHLGELEGRPISDFLARGGVDQRVLLEQAGRKGRIRLFSTRLQRAYGNQLPVEIAAAALDDRADAGFGLIVRDISRREAPAQSDATTGADVGTQGGMDNMMNLVGSTPLKGIVSATTDVIERMCIETALDLTGNNRVAAAEMLGLSRQSLYVKLRKFDLLARES